MIEITAYPAVIGAVLPAMILKLQGYHAKSFPGFQAGILTDRISGMTGILDIDCKNVPDPFRWKY